MLVLAYDRAPCAASDRMIDENGRLHVANCPISKATVNPYYGSEIPGWREMGLVADRKYMMLRPPEELERAASTFNNIQLLDEHLPVHAEDPQNDNVAGTTGTDTYFDGVYLRTTLSVWTQDAIDAVDDEEKRQLSSSYSYTPIMESGVFNGLRYDGRMSNIVGNHVALVKEGRAGPDVHVSDALPKGFRMKKSLLLRTVRGLANDADISVEELAALANDAAAKDDEMNDDPNVDDEDPDAKADDEEPKADDEEPKADDEDPDADDELPGAHVAQDRAPRRPAPPAMDAAAIERNVIARFTAWNTACEKVAPFIGRVKIAMDAAPDGARGLYRKALDAAGVNHRGVTQTIALERMVDALPKPSAAFAMDSARSSEPSVLDGVLPASVPHRS